MGSLRTSQSSAGKQSDQVDMLFAKAVELPPTERETFLQKECAGLAPDIRAEIESLLAADHAIETDQLFMPIAGLVDLEEVLKNDKATFEPETTVIGAYRLLEKIGDGGMGVVYMAEQEQPVRRRVALKVIKPGMDSKLVCARFDAERQALALMDHPNIAKVLDVGTTQQERPYFVMELVKGLPITEYCDANRLSIEARLQLYLAVCRAIQHAHQKGIIHRDIKPSNVLVAEYDGEPVVKVIDFGLAKALQQPLTEKTLFTQFGHVIGTYEYMSPEQASFNQLDVDTRADTYALGVLLYELLTGSPPFDSKTLRGAAFDEMLRMIREVDPPRPSQKLTTVEDRVAVADKRQTVPIRINRVLSGDLDAIVMKALEKERARRYDTSGALADDVRRFLNHEPVSAKRPSATYYVARFIGRHRAVSAAAAAILVLLTSTFVVTAISWLRAEEQTKHYRYMNLVAQSQTIRQELPQRSALLAIETARAIQEDGTCPIALEALAHENLMQAVVSIPGTPVGNGWNSSHFGGSDISRDGRWAMTSTKIGDKTESVQLWNLEGDRPPLTPALSVPAHSSRLDSHVHRFSVADHDGTIRYWDLTVGLSTTQPVIIGKFCPLESFDLSRNGRWLGLISREPGRREVKLYRLDEHRHVIREYSLGLFEGDDSSTFQFAQITSDDRWLIVNRLGGPTMLWRLTDEDFDIRPFVISAETKTDRLHGPVVSMNGRWLFMGSLDPKASVWDLALDNPTLKPVKTVPKATNSMASNEDGTILATVSDRLQVWDLSRDDGEYRRLRGHRTHPTSVDLSPDGRWLVSGGYDSTVRVWDLHEQDPAANCRVLRGHEGLIKRVSIGPKGRWVLSAGQHVEKLWDLESLAPGTPPLVLPAARTTDLANIEETRVREMAVSDDSRWLATCSEHNTVRLWNLEDENPAGTGIVLKNGLESRLSRFANLPDGNLRLLTSGTNASTRLWEIANTSGAASHRVLSNQPGTGLGHIDLSPNGRWALMADSEEQIWLWDMESDDDDPRQIGNGVAAFDVRFSPDSRRIAITTWGGRTKPETQILLWDTEHLSLGPTVLRDHDPERIIMHMKFTKDSQSLFTSGYDGKVIRWDISGSEMKPTPTTLYEGKSVSHMAVSPDGRWLAISHYPYDTAELRDLTKQNQLLNLTAEGGLHKMTISPDGRWLGVGTGDDRAFLWDLSSKDISQSRRVLRGHKSAIDSLLFTPDGRFFVTGGADGNVVLWPLGVDDLMGLARQAAGRSLTVAERRQAEL